MNGHDRYFSIDDFWPSSTFTTDGGFDSIVANRLPTLKKRYWAAIIRCLDKAFEHTGVLPRSHSTYLYSSWKLQ